MIKYYKYEKEKLNFVKELQELYQVDDLSLLHLKLQKDFDISGLGADTHTDYHKMFYEKLHSGWESIQELYVKLIKEVIYPTAGEDKILYQVFPSYRIQLPNNQAVKKWHFDSDADHKHPEGEINFIMPLTAMYTTNAVWVEKTEGVGDFIPLLGDVGDIIKFNGNKHAHGNKINLTERTRISFDFRILPYSKYDPDYPEITATSGFRFIIGEYYRLYEGEK